MKDENFNNYELGLDKFISQYKNHLEMIKSNRQGKNHYSCNTGKSKDASISLTRDNFFSEESISNTNLNFSPNKNDKNDNFNYVYEENEKLKKKVLALTMELENKEELKVRNENLQKEINKLITAELNLQREKSELISKLKNEEVSSNNAQLKNIQNYYEEKINSRDQDIYYLKSKINEDTSKKNILNNLIVFIKKNMKLLDNNKKFENVILENYNSDDFENLLREIDILISTLINDNTDLVKRFSSSEFSNDLVESLKIKKLNILIDDLKIENSLLKNQINNLLKENSNYNANNNNKIKQKVPDNKDKVEHTTKINKKKKISKDTSFSNNISESFTKNKPPLAKQNSVKFIHQRTKTENNLKLTKIHDINETEGLTSELNQLEELKRKIKDLESKIGEINKDEKEKRIVDSLRDFRVRNMSPSN